jgi:hypothetical protein
MVARSLLLELYAGDLTRADDQFVSREQAAIAARRQHLVRPT